jgi:hypothetical protein
MAWLSNLWNRAKNWVSGAYNTVKQGVSNVWNNHIKPVVSKIPLVGGAISSAVEGLGNTIDTGARAAGNLAEGKLKDFGKNMLKLGVEKLGSYVPLIGGKAASLINEHVVDKLKRGGMVKAPKMEFQRKMK